MNTNQDWMERVGVLGNRVFHDLFENLSRTIPAACGREGGQKGWPKLQHHHQQLEDGVCMHTYLLAWDVDSIL